ncbi:hypothetical protein A2U01_0076339, partial [Trifolium medium]|nr:hypothetical protein [Trifolium medium]
MQSSPNLLSISSLSNTDLSVAVLTYLQ